MLSFISGRKFNNPLIVSSVLIIWIAYPHPYKPRKEPQSTNIPKKKRKRKVRTNPLPTHL
jgi:hypothetical protein